MNYDKKELAKLLTPDTITALIRIYGLRYRHLAYKLNCTRPNISYKQRTNTWKDYEKEILLDTFLAFGMDGTSLILISNMITTAKKVKTD